MESPADDPPLYTVERTDDAVESWRVVGPAGVVGIYDTESKAQAGADFLNRALAHDGKRYPR